LLELSGDKTYFSRFLWSIEVNSCAIQHEAARKVTDF